MRLRLQEQLIILEERIRALRDSLTGQHCPQAERARTQADIQTGELTLAHLRKAFGG